MNKKLRERIHFERRVLGLKPWEFAPSEVDDGPCPYRKGKAGHDAWHKALKLKHELDELMKEHDDD